MTQEELKKEYDKYDTPIMFDALKEGVESQIVQTEVYKGVYYEIFPYSFQRVGMRKGKPVKLSNRLKSTNNLYFYGFNEKKQIVEVREGCEIENQFDYQFLSYYDVYIKSLAYDGDKELMNISFYNLNQSHQIESIQSVGCFGAEEEEYFYDDNGRLHKIKVRQFDSAGEEGATLFYTIYITQTAVWTLSLSLPLCMKRLSILKRKNKLHPTNKLNVYAILPLATGNDGRGKRERIKGQARSHLL